MELRQQILEQPCLININKEVNRLPGIAAQSAHWSKRSIYRIPACIADLNGKAYKPQLVSIGPYHHGMEHLKGMEEHKHRSLVHFLKRSDIQIETLMNGLIPKVEDIKDAYDQLDTEWHKNTGKFLAMMILDGCFILEVLRTYEEASPSSNVRDYARNDPIFSKHGNLYIVPYLKRDMLMLENQIPILVLEILVSVQNNPSLKDPEEMTKLILKFFSKPITAQPLNKFDKYLHLLDMYRKSLHPQETPSNNERGNIQQGGPEIIRSATELIEAGIHIKPSTSNSIKGISFNRKKGVLELPHLVVDDAFESLYLNLIAFEKFHVGVGNEVTSFIFFMDNLIDKDEDVSRLHSCKVMQNALGSDKAVADLFNSLSKDITLDPESNLHHVHKEVTAYCQEICHRWEASFWQSYCGNPWLFISIVAAICIFVLTIVQAVYAVLAYVKPPKSS